MDIENILAFMLGLALILLIGGIFAITYVVGTIMLIAAGALVVAFTVAVVVYTVLS